MHQLRDIRSALSDQDMAKVVNKTAGYSGSDMRNLIQEACQGPIRDAGASTRHSISVHAAHTLLLLLPSTPATSACCMRQHVLYVAQTVAQSLLHCTSALAQSRRGGAARCKRCGMTTCDQWCCATLHWRRGHSVPAWSLLKSYGTSSTTSGMVPSMWALRTRTRLPWTTGGGCDWCTFLGPLSKIRGAGTRSISNRNL